MYKIYTDYIVQPRGRTKKLLKVMKLITLLLFLTVMQVSATTYAQKVSLNVKNSPLSTVLDQISDQTGYNFFYSNSALNDTRPVSLMVKNVDLNEVLHEIFASQPLEFRIQDKTVVIKEKTVALSKTQTLPKQVAPESIITGTVTDEHGKAIPGVTIKVKGSHLFAVTNQKGIFLLSVPAPDAILQFSFIGFLTKEIPANQITANEVIVLKEDISKLSEVQVIGYGTTTKRANTGDVTTIDAKTIAQYPTSNVLDVLQGTVPGLVINKQSGNPSSTYSVAIRGRNGLTASPPYYVIDGVPYQGGTWVSNNYNVAGGTGPNGQGRAAYDALGVINPDDIESITVLKDADATSIYGSRGADGVILITTKKGKAGATRIDASVYTGVNDVARRLPLFSLQQYLQMRREAFKNDGLPVPSIITTPNNTNYDINGSWDTTRNTDWQKTLIGGFGHTTKTQVGISGGSEQIQYRISGGYNFDSNLMHLGGSNQSASLNANLTTSTKDKKFTASFSGGYFYSNNTQAAADMTSTAMTLAPDAPALYNADGSLNFQNKTFTNPLLQRNFINNAPQDNMTSSLTLSYKPVKNLEILVTSGYNKQNQQEFVGVPSTAIPPYQTAFPNSQFLYQHSSSWNITPQVNYTLKTGKGTLAATLGANVQSMNYNMMGLNATGYSSDLLLSSPTAGSTLTVSYPYFESNRKNAAWFGRINYNWADKYYLDITGRRDGSSNFGPNKQFHLFSAVGAGWIFSEENLIKNNLPFLSFGKLRGSYGATGRDNITPYSFLSSYNNTAAPVPYAGVVGLSPTGLPNPNLSWETTTKAELGLELQFFKGRIALETNFYRNRTTGLLAPSTLSIVTGFSSITQNMPATTQTKGFDVSLTTTNIKNKSLTWSTMFQFTRDRSILYNYPDLATSSYANQYIIGMPVNIIKTYHFGGVNPQTGVYQFVAANGSMVTTPNGATDRTVLINTNPNFYGSVQNNISYKGFGLSFLLRYKKQIGKNLFSSAANGLVGSASNIPTIMLDRWQKPGDIASVQRYSTNNIALLFTGSTAGNSDAGYSDASYIRLQNFSLSYSVPSKTIQKLGMQNLQIFVQGDNLFTITGYSGLDPETQSINSLPPLRIITAGLKLTL